MSNKIKKIKKWKKEHKGGGKGKHKKIILKK